MNTSFMLTELTMLQAIFLFIAIIGAGILLSVAIKFILSRLFFRR